MTLSPLRRGGPGDPSVRFDPAGMWRASHTPMGPVTTHLTLAGRQVTVEAWGPGAAWALEKAPVLVGAMDSTRDFEPGQGMVAELHRRHPGLRLVRTEAVFEALVPVILEQKVIGAEARAAYRGLVRELGRPAPGPAGLRLPPAPEVLAETPYYALHRHGVERRRADTIRLAAARASRLEEAVRMAPEDAQRRLRSIPGIGAWSAAAVMAVALGDPDAVPVGDYHLPHLVTFAFTGRPRGDDATMLELLEPYRGHRGRVIRLLMASGISAPRYGPRLALRRL